MRVMLSSFAVLLLGLSDGVCTVDLSEYIPFISPPVPVVPI